MNELLRIERDLYINKDKLNKQTLIDMNWLIERVKMLEKVLKTSDKAYKALSEMLICKESLINQMEEEYRMMCEKCNKDV